MQVKISKTLEGIIARTAFNTTKEGAGNALKDRLLLELLREEGSLAYQILSARMKDRELQQVRQRIEHDVEATRSAEQHDPEQFYRRFCNEICARNESAVRISTAHALLEILRDPSTSASRALALHGITESTVLAELARIGGDQLQRREIEVRLLDFGSDRPIDLRNPNDLRNPKSQLLDKFGTDLTAEAREGRIDPVVGRDAEIERVVQILSRRKKNNPMLIGEAGVGKTAIVEGLALRIAEGRVPCTIRGKRLFSLDVSSLVAGTKFRGEFEERMQQLLEELKRSDDTILFIDEIHTIVGAGSTQGSLDTANILKPALARGELQTIGATTLDEYRENIERDPALERRFRRVMIEPTTQAETLQILRNIAPRYERHHNVRYTEEALRACVELTERYVTDRYFPDKAIDLLDETGSQVRLQQADEPGALRELATAIADVQRERREAVEAAVYDKAASARMRELKLRSQLDADRSAWLRSMEEHPAEVGAAEVCRVLTAMTGIPADRISDGEAGRLRTLHSHLNARVIGQQEAVEKIARAILRSRAGLKDARRPIGVFLFVGPTGVGKTHLAKEVSKWLFDEHRGLIRIDMSEYGEKHNVARLIGAPPGYVGYGEGGRLTEAVRRRPYSVVLFDEIEKAHPDVFNILLQIFDEGCLTDGSGRKVDFRNTILILTSNVGSRAAAERQVQVGYTTRSKSVAEVAAPETEYRKALEQTFAPEFLNRIDEVVFFRPLGNGDIERIIDLELAGLMQRTEAMGYRIKITDRARRRLASMGYERRYGARALKRTLTDHVEEPIAQLIIDGRLHEGDTVVVEGGRSEGVRLRVA